MTTLRRRRLLTAAALAVGLASRRWSRLSGDGRTGPAAHSQTQQQPRSAIGDSVRLPDESLGTIHEDVVLNGSVQFQRGIGPDGVEFVRVVDGNRRAFIVRRPGKTTLLRTTNGAVTDLRQRTDQPIAAPDSRPMSTARVERSLVRRAPRPRVIRVLFLYTLRALAECGGRRERLRQLVWATLDPTNETYAPHGIHFAAADILPVPDDDRGLSGRQLCHALDNPGSREFGAIAAALETALDVDRICLIASRRGREHGYALMPSERSGSTCGKLVVRVADLGHGDLTLAHELGHTLGLEHSDDDSVMSRTGTRRRIARPR